MSKKKKLLAAIGKALQGESKALRKYKAAIIPMKGNEAEDVEAGVYATYRKAKNSYVDAIEVTEEAMEDFDEWASKGNHKDCQDRGISEPQRMLTKSNRVYAM